MKYLAHTENTEGKPHILSEHLLSVGELACDFAKNNNSDLCEAAYWTGLLHDLGKYRDEFQQYLRAERNSSAETHHAVYGAALAYRQEWLGPAFAVAGHHAGLHDHNELLALVEGATYRTTERVPQLVDRFKAELGEIPQKITEPSFVAKVHSEHSAEFYIRMLFSMLVDADFLDTEAHYKAVPRITHKLQAIELLRLVIAEKESKTSDGKLNAIRNRIFQQCLDKAQEPPGVFSLTVPTGGGKTLAGMAFALAHAAQPLHQLRRIIVVIPYLSIIEQNAAQYRRILDPENLGIVIEHHSAVNVPEDTGESRSRAPFEKHPNEYAAENWDAPIIVTTSVQFIESLFANRTSRCRKLHNIAHSVVIFDEVQTLPSHLLNPLLSVFRELRDNYGVSFVFSTATQPAFQHNPSSLTEGFKKGEIQEITEGNTEENFHSLRRVFIQPPKPNETTGWDALAEQMAQPEQALCIVNIRRHAYDLWEKLRRTVPQEEKDAVFHLSSAMCAEHRFAILGDDREPEPDTIRYRLRHKLPCRLVSTQLIEAGVDVDFPIVWRSLGPLDSIVQAAGRCNRESRLQDEAGNPVLGKVIVFQPEDNTLPQGVYRTASDITAALLAQVEANTLATDHTLFRRYFDQLYQLVPTDQKTSIQGEREKLHFRKVAELAKVIDNDTQAVIVPYGKGCNIIEEIRMRPVIKGQPRFSRDDLRKLQRYMVNLHSRDFQKLGIYKAISPLLPNLEIYVLAEGWYHPNLGIVIDKRPTEDFFV
ncbi:CRISPR-associated helicase/endonuclease Cas3 [Nitrosomonas sp. Nm166]|uniref:CRISPR-associated helicase/endonuclease Cas3 n=1 Tax=Nitrosomonas sp. Nm166 TaxID=1881054 RepID=UPI0008EEA729|nr:CRISPR-associated helicase/endonuclease Cas3 [Nitrosomonas sp. Nm166]SFE11431.1 CRISPR-associated endonuclease/helicase Cas3 [Nitrosomonas sp. Nm166]